MSYGAVSHNQTSVQDEGARLMESNPTTSSDDELFAKWGTKLIVAAIVLTIINTAVVGGIVYMGFSALHETNETLQPFNAIMHGPSTPQAQPYVANVMKTVRDVASGAVTFFIFGDENGSIASFLTKVMRFDFMGAGVKGEAFGLKANQTFAGKSCGLTYVWCNQTSPNNSWVSVPLQCPPTPGYPQGRTRWCYQNPAQYNYGPQMMKMDCDDIGCPFEDMRLGMDAMRSMMGIVKNFQLPASANQSSTAQIGDPSFSTGIFRIDKLLGWIVAQMDLPAWAGFGNTCSTFFGELKAVNWTSCYTWQGQQNCWDVHDSMQQFFNRSQQVCNVVSQLQ